MAAAAVARRHENGRWRSELIITTTTTTSHPHRCHPCPDTLTHRHSTSTHTGHERGAKANSDYFGERESEHARRRLRTAASDEDGSGSVVSRVMGQRALLEERQRMKSEELQGRPGRQQRVEKIQLASGSRLPVSQSVVDGSEHENTRFTSTRALSLGHCCCCCCGRLSTLR